MSGRKLLADMTASGFTDRRFEVADREEASGRPKGGTMRSRPVPRCAGGTTLSGAPTARWTPLDAAQCAEKGLLIRRALDLMGA
jgi:hypothetical protein